ncbi:unnamed protein product [Symbiodinium pilosum]|uniref:Glycosyl hydrolase family 95 catalytic domain-containing protein n=1 Tax=Symbiodinium pilosum TaxID=2952 RepID=A0A812Y2X3_SYMPI|nr:unnamed protein product [Symbiodinium pilosum]
MSQYLLRISSWAGSTPGLFGPFVMDDEVLWSGDITLNYNAEAIYYNAAAANHMEAFLPYFRAVLDFLPAARRMASELYPQCSNSLVFPAHILPHGVHAAGVGGGDLAQKQIGLFAAVPFILYWRYSGSIVFAESSLPFLAGIARFWECNLLMGEDGFLHDANDCAEEICLPDGDLQPDPSVVLSLLPSFFTMVAEVAELLNAETAETRQRWRSMAGRIAPYATEVIDGEEVIADFYGGETKHGLALRLHAGGSVAWGGLFAAFPLGTVHQRSEKAAVDLVHRSLARFFKQWPGGKQGNSFPHVFAAAARVGWRAEREGLLRDWEAYLTNTSDPKCRLHSNGMVLGCGSTGLENVGGAAFATEMLLQMSSGVLQVFPSLPVGMAASFRLRAPGPVMVAASRETSGEVTDFRLQLPTLESDVAMGPTVVRTDFLVQSPWPGSEILVDGQVADVRSGVFRVGLTEGRIHQITPAAKKCRENPNAVRPATCGGSDIL